MVKGEKKDARASNQPSLLAFWGRQSKTPAEASKTRTNDEKDKLENAKNNDNCIKDESALTKRRLDTSDHTPSELSPHFFEQFRREAVTPDYNTEPSLTSIVSSTRTCTDMGNDEQNPAGNTADVAPQNLMVSWQDTPNKENLSHPKRSEMTNQHGDKADEFKSDDEDTKGDSSDEEDEENEEADNSRTANNPEGLSDYELLRLRNIARNNERLKALGLISHVEEPNQKSRKRQIKRSHTRPKKAAFTAPPPPTRRSTRLSKSNTGTCPPDNFERHNIGSEEMNEQKKVEEEVEEMYEVSPIVHYDMERGHFDDTATDDMAKAEFNSRPCLATDERVSCLVPSNHRLRPPPGLSHIYSLNFSDDNKGWLVGAGKSGIISLWKGHSSNAHKDNDDDVFYTEPVLSWKGHSGRWISEAQFVGLNSNKASPFMLLTAANDGLVCLWDLSQVSTSTGTPKMLQHSNKTSWHSNGIFAMDLNRTPSSTKIVTGSKDKTIAVGSLGEEFSPVWRSEFHTKTVKAVKFRDHNVLASASDDGCVAVMDDRIEGGTSPTQVLEGLHNGRPHSVLWDPVNSDVFLTAGLDSVIQAWDLRFLKQHQPLCEYYGHIPLSTRRCKRINHPAFYRPFEQNSQRFLLSGGEGSHALSMFLCSKDRSNLLRNKLERHAVYSRGTLPHDCSLGDVGSIAIQGESVAVSVDGGEILVLVPSPFCESKS